MGGRLIGIGLAHLSFKCCLGNDINFSELCFILYGGMIRGAIAFGLVLKIPDESDIPMAKRQFPHREQIVTTTLSLVIITTFIFGTFMKLASKFFVPIVKKVEDEPNMEIEFKVTDSINEGEKHNEIENDQKEKLLNKMDS